MLRKLMKYEFKATSRSFLPLFAAMLLLSLINGFFMGPSMKEVNPFLEAVRNVLMFVYIIMTCALFVLTMVITIRRFYKNLTGDEGYLMFTLPVKTHTLLLSKLFVAVIWQVASAVVTVGSIALLFIRQPDYYSELYYRFPEAMQKIHSTFGASFDQFLWYMAAALVIGLFTSVLQIYASIAIGQLAREHRVLISIGVYFGISIVMQIAASMIMMIPLFSQASMLVQVEQTQVTQLFQIINTTLLPMLLIDILVGVAFFVATNLIFKKKLNLE